MSRAGPGAEPFRFNVKVGSDANAVTNPFVQPQNPALSGGGRDQSLQFADDLIGTPLRDILIGRLGVDLLLGGDGPGHPDRRHGALQSGQP